MAIGATIALPQLLRHGYDKRMVTGVIQAGSSLGILIPPSVVLVLYAMIARQPVLQLWLAGILPGLLMAVIFAHLRLHPLPHQSGAGAGAAGGGARGRSPAREKFTLLREGILPLLVFAIMMGLFLTGVTSLVESSVVGALLATIAAAIEGKLTWKVIEDTTRNTLLDQLHVPLDHPRRALLQLGL